MFDIGFTEILIISVVALIVLGPDKLPGAIRTAGLWIGRLRRSFNTIKADIEREVGADEIRRQLRNEEIMEKIKNTRTQFKESVDSVKKEAESVKEDIKLDKELSSLTGKEAEERASGIAGKGAEASPPASSGASEEAGVPPAGAETPAGEKPAVQPVDEPAPDAGSEPARDAPREEDAPIGGEAPGRREQDKPSEQK